MSRDESAPDASLNSSWMGVAWLGLGVLLSIGAWAPGGNVVRLITIIPWALGMACWIARRDTMARSWSAISSPNMTLALITLGVVAGICWWAFGLFAVTALSAWSGLVIMGLLASGRPLAVKAILESSALVSTTVVLAALTSEAILRRPAIAGQLGLPSEQRRIEARYDHLERENVLGFRSRHERIAKPPATTRIVAIGDSFTWGDHILRADSTWPAQLEDTLRHIAGGVEVVNMAQRGYTTVNEVEALNRLGWQLDPDVILVQWLINDVYPSSPGFRRILSWPPVPDLLPARLRDGAINRSDLYGLLEKVYASWRLGDQRGLLPALYVESNPDWQANKAAFKELGDSARVRGIPVVVMIWPEITTTPFTATTHPFRRIHELVAGVARSSGLRVFDLTPVFAGAGGGQRRLWVKPYDRHPSPAADALVAHALADYLVHEGIVRQAAAATVGRAAH